MQEELFKSLVNWGPGAVLCGLIILALYRLAEKFGTKAIEAQTSQAVALTAQAESMKGFQTALTDFLAKDNNEHREMLVLLKYIAQDKVDLDRVRTEHDQLHLCGKPEK